MNAAPEPKPSFRARLLGGIRSSVSRCVAAARQRWLLTILCGVGSLTLLLGGGALAFWMLAAREETISVATLEQAFAALDAGELDEARLIAVELRTRDRLPPESRGGPAFVLGTAMAITASAAPNPEELRNLHEIAARYLQEAADIGFPPGFEAEGAFRLGESLFQVDRFAEAAPKLQTALQLKHPESAALHRMLATAYFLDSEPNLKAALHHNQALLNEKSLTDEALEGAVLQQAEIAFRLNDDGLLNRALAQIRESKATQSILVAGKVLEARSLLRGASRPENQANALALRKQARELLLAVLESGKTPRELQAEAAYFIGKLDFAEKQLDAALTMFSRARRLAGGSALVVAITLEEGDVHLARVNSPDRAASAVASYRRVLKPMDSKRPFVNPWLTRDEIAARSISAAEKLLAEREFGAALDLSSALALATDSIDALRLTSQIEMSWGRKLQSDSVVAGVVDADRAKSAREHLLRAAHAYRALAERRLSTREFATLMQQAASLFEDGRDYESARKALTRTLEVQGRTERPETLVMLGKVLLDLDRLDEAIGALNECFLSFRRNPVSYRARLLASHALVEQGKLDDARRLLHANLWEEDLSPESTDWRDSLFALADLLFVQARVALAEARDKAAQPNSVKTEIADAFDRAATLFDEAAQRLSEAVSRYPESEQSVLARYQLAECNRCLARNKMRLSDNHPILTAKGKFDREAKEYLALALTDLSIVQTQLNQRADVRELNNTERKLLRNCYFLSADCLFDRGDYDAAIQAYADAAGRYQTEPVAIEAFAQIAASYRKLKRPDDEYTAIGQAQAMLNRLPPNIDFSMTTRATRGEWAEYLSWRAATR